MISKCREFATLLAIDDEFKVGQDEDAEGNSFDAVADLDDTGPGPGSLGGQRPGKRKNSVSSQNPAKRPRGRKSGSGKKRASTEPEDDMIWD